VDAGDGQSKRQLTIPVKIVRYLQFIQRIQRLYMTEETAKQMTWHKKGVRYNPDKMVHPSDGESWTHFDEIHHEKARWVQSLWYDGRIVLMLARVRYSLESPPRRSLSTTNHICVVDYS